MSFQQGLSGLNSAAKNLDAIGNNVANAATIGFKQSQTQFADAYAASLGGAGSLQTGSGGRVAAVAQQFTQGNVATTNNPLDVAISGAGFFRMADPSGAISYSRNGQFHEDKNGFIVNSLGHNVTGYEANAAGTIQKILPPVPLQISATDKRNDPVITSTATVAVNLVSTAPGIATAFNPSVPATYTSSTALAVYDVAGGSHVASLYYQRQPLTPLVVGAAIPAAPAGSPLTTVNVANITGLAVGNTITLPNGGAVAPGTPTTVTITAITPGAGTAGMLTYTPASIAAETVGPISTNAGSNLWSVYLTVDGASVPPTAPATAMTTLTFNVNGTLATPAPGQLTPSAAPAYPGGVAINFDLSASTQFAGVFNVNSLTQNGYALGTLSGYSTGADGTIIGRYTNGQTKNLGQFLLATFASPQGLQPVGNNEWTETVASGIPLTVEPGKSSTGVLQSSAVEDSNVDLTAELVNMIVAQRMYQANAQTIKAQDQILQTIVNLK